VPVFDPLCSPSQRPENIYPSRRGRNFAILMQPAIFVLAIREIREQDIAPPEKRLGHAAGGRPINRVLWGSAPCGSHVTWHLHRSKSRHLFARAAKYLRVSSNVRRSPLA
jgi:hypothetical protein